MRNVKTLSFNVGKRNDNGQALVEFTLTILFIFLVFVGLLEMIFLMYAYNTLADSAKEGIRYAIVHGTGNTNCSGPGTSGPPAVACSDTTGANVKSAVIDGRLSNGTLTNTPPAGVLSMQNIVPSNVTVDYNPNSANGAACNVPGCLVRVTVSKAYRPFFGLGWPSVTLYAAADGRIMN